MARIVWSLILIISFLVWPALAPAQNSLPEGEPTYLRGKVTNKKGAVIANPKVTLLNLETQWSKTVTGDDNGSFTFHTLTSGRYRITASAEGFSSLQKIITLKRGRRTTVSLKLNKPSN